MSSGRGSHTSLPEHWYRMGGLLLTKRFNVTHASLGNQKQFSTSKMLNLPSWSPEKASSACWHILLSYWEGLSEA